MAWFNKRILSVTGLILFLTAQAIVSGGCLGQEAKTETEGLTITQIEGGRVTVLIDEERASIDYSSISGSRKCYLFACPGGNLSSASFPEHGTLDCVVHNVGHGQAEIIQKAPIGGQKYYAGPYSNGKRIEIAYTCADRAIFGLHTMAISIAGEITIAIATAPGAQAPSAPTALSAMGASSQVDLSWTDNSSDETGFRVERADSGSGIFASLGTVSANTTNYADTTIVPDTLYDYRVFAFNGAGDSAATSVESAMVMAPGAPGALNAFAVASQVNLTWMDTSMDETGFVVERSLSSGTGFTQIGTSPADDGTYFDTTVSPSTTYYYRVKSVRGSIESAYSAEASITSNP